MQFPFAPFHCGDKDLAFLAASTSMGTPIDRVVSGGFGITGGGGARGNLATDNGGGQVETVLSEAKGVEHDTD